MPVNEFCTEEKEKKEASLEHKKCPNCDRGCEDALSLKVEWRQFPGNRGEAHAE